MIFWNTRIQFLDFRCHLVSLLEKAMTPHSSTPAWRIPWMEEPGRLQSMGSLRVGHDWLFTFHFHALEKEMATHSSVLAWRIPGMGEPGGLPSVGLHRDEHDWSDLVVVVVRKHQLKKKEKTALRISFIRTVSWCVPLCWGFLFVETTSILIVPWPF